MIYSEFGSKIITVIISILGFQQFESGGRVMALEMVETVRRAETDAAHAESSAETERERILSDARKQGDVSAAEMKAQAKKKAATLTQRAKDESKQKEKAAMDSAQNDIALLRAKAAEKKPEAIRMIISEFY